MRSVIDPITRIEGHLRVEMEVTNGVVSEAWVSGGLFRGMELILEGREPGDAAYIAQRICGVCPVSHAHASCFASEKAMGIEKLPEGARLVRNIVEASQFLHSNILWFYNLNGLDYVDPTNALSADVASTYDLARAANTGIGDFKAVKDHLQTFVDNGQMSIFSGNWFSRDGYSLTPEMDLLLTSHYLEGLEYQALASEISGVVGGKMPHIMSSVPGGTTFLPTAEKLDDVLFRAQKLNAWVEGTLLPDAIALAPFYARGLDYGHGVGRYVAWGVFNDESQDPSKRYLPAGVLNNGVVTVPDESLITEYTGHSYYATDQTLNPRQGVTDPQYPAGGQDLNGKYSWCKTPQYDGLPYEAGPLSRVLVAYNSGVKRIQELVDYALQSIGFPGQPQVLQSTLGRVVARSVETVYTSELLLQFIQDLIDVMKSGDAEYYVEGKEVSGEGAGMWEAPRGALYHYVKLNNKKIEKYQIIIPTTWNIAPKDVNGVRGPMEEALIGCPVDDPEKPIDALRTVHSFDPCVACAIHVSEPATGKHFETVTNPWGVK